MAGPPAFMVTANCGFLQLALGRRKRIMACKLTHAAHNLVRGGGGDTNEKIMYTYVYKSNSQN
jgi:hypothetical protein